MPKVMINMEMPECCAKCRFRREHKGIGLLYGNYCPATGKYDFIPWNIIEEELTASFCPLQEVKE